MTAKRNRGIPGPPPLLLSATRRKCPSRSTLRYPFPPHALKKGASAGVDSGWRAYSIYKVVVKSSAPVYSAKTRRNPSLQRFAFVRRGRSWVPSPLAGEGQGEGKSSGNESTHPNEKCCKLPSAVADRRDREGMGMRDRDREGWSGLCLMSLSLSHLSVSGAYLWLTAMARASQLLASKSRAALHRFRSSPVAHVALGIRAKLSA